MADQQPRRSSSSNELNDPPNDWAFNNLLADISRRLRKEDLAEIKLRYHGIIGIDVKTLAEAFNTLVIKGFISDNNLIYLQHIIRVLNRADLLATVIEYATKQSALYFSETTTDIRPGHRLVRIHVVDGRCQTRGDLDTMRMTISQILSVPPEDIVYAGIQEANSLYIIFTLPAIYVETLEKFLEDKTKHRILRPLFQLGIDRIKISETSFELEPGEETKRSDDKSDRIGIINKLQQQLEEEIPRQKRYKDEVSNTKNQSSGKQSARKRKQLPDLKESENKRCNKGKAGSFIYNLRERAKKQDSHPIDKSRTDLTRYNRKLGWCN